MTETLTSVSAIENSEIAERIKREDGDVRFQEAMLRAGYGLFVCTKPGTDFPRMMAAPVVVHTRGMWDFGGFK